MNILSRMFGLKNQSQVQYVSLFEKHELSDLKEQMRLLLERHKKLEFQVAQLQLENQLLKSGQIIRQGIKGWDNA